MKTVRSGAQINARCWFPFIRSGSSQGFGPLSFWRNIKIVFLTIPKAILPNEWQPLDRVATINEHHWFHFLHSGSEENFGPLAFRRNSKIVLSTLPKPILLKLIVTPKNFVSFTLKPSGKTVSSPYRVLVRISLPKLIVAPEISILLPKHKQIYALKRATYNLTSQSLQLATWHPQLDINDNLTRNLTLWPTL